MITLKDAAEAKLWVEESRDTTQYINRCLVVSALKALDDPGCATRAADLLRTVIGLKGTVLMHRPDFVDEDDAIIVEKLAST
jgi:hypothetical protein